MDNLNVGDYVLFKYDTKEVYPGRILSISKKGRVKVEICTNKCRKGFSDIEIVEGTLDQVRQPSVM